MQTTLARLIKKHGPLKVLEEFHSICRANAKQCGQVGKRCKYWNWKELGYGSSSRWFRWTRELGRAVGALRHDEPDSLPVERGRR